MENHYIVLALFALGGWLSLLAALLDWDWFFTAQNVYVARRSGRRAARWFYGVLGAFLIATSVFFFLQLQG